MNGQDMEFDGAAGLIATPGKLPTWMDCESFGRMACEFGFLGFTAGDEFRAALAYYEAAVTGMTLLEMERDTVNHPYFRGEDGAERADADDAALMAMTAELQASTSAAAGPEVIAAEIVAAPGAAGPVAAPGAAVAGELQPSMSPAAPAVAAPAEPAAAAPAVAAPAAPAPAAPAPAAPAPAAPAPAAPAPAEPAAAAVATDQAAADSAAAVDSLSAPAVAAGGATADEIVELVRLARIFVQKPDEAIITMLCTGWNTEKLDQVPRQTVLNKIASLRRKAARGSAPAAADPAEVKRAADAAAVDAAAAAAPAAAQ